MDINLSSITSGLGSLMPSGDDIVSSVIKGAAVSVVMTGLKNGGAASLDPLGLFHKDAPAVAPTNNPNASLGPTITASAFSALAAPAQSQLLAAGVHIVAG